MDFSDVAYPQEIECCGRLFIVARSLEIARRLEAHLGPCFDLSVKLQEGRVTLTDVTAVYARMLEGQADAPKRPEIEAWVFEVGTAPAARQICWYIASLTIGNALARSLHEKLAASTGEARSGVVKRGPFSMTDASTGPTSSTSDASSDGHPSRPIATRSGISGPH